MGSRDGSGGFGALLRRLRGGAGLTQEALAEKSGLSVRSVRGLARGDHKPRPDTVGYLARALGLEGDGREAFERVARGPAPAAGVNDGMVVALGGTGGDPAERLLEPPTPLLGRERLVAEAVALLRRGDMRLLTLTGTGGVGKTRAGLRVAAELGPDYPGGVVPVGLAPIEDPGLVAPTIARALGVPDAGGEGSSRSA